MKQFKKGQKVFILSRSSILGMSASQGFQIVCAEYSHSNSDYHCVLIDIEDEEQRVFTPVSDPYIFTSVKDAIDQGYMSYIPSITVRRDTQKVEDTERLDLENSSNEVDD